MEEDILKILTDCEIQTSPHCKVITDRDCAKLIVSSMSVFIEWVGENCFKYEGSSSGWLVIMDEPNDIELGDIESVYQYWKENINIKQHGKRRVKKSSEK